MKIDMSDFGLDPQTEEAKKQSGSKKEQDGGATVPSALPKAIAAGQAVDGRSEGVAAAVGTCDSPGLFDAESGSQYRGESTIPLLHVEKEYKPAYRSKREKYEHRVIAMMKAEGKTNTEIANETGYTTAMVNYVVRQPHIERLILETIHKHGGDAVMNVFKQNGEDAAQTLVEIMNDDDAAKRDRLAAANAVLDRLYGKPNAPITVQSKAPTELSDEELVAIAQNAKEN